MPLPSSPTPYIIVALVIAAAVVALLLLLHIWVSPRQVEEEFPAGPPSDYWPTVKPDGSRRVHDWLAVDPPTWHW